MLRPPLIELNLQLLGEEVPRQFIFWLPPVKELALTEPAPEAQGTAPDMEVEVP